MKCSFQYIHANTGWWNSEVRADRNCVLLKQACETTLVPQCFNSDVQGLQYFWLPIARAKRTSQLVPTWTSFNDCEERTAPLAGTTRTRLLGSFFRSADVCERGLYKGETTQLLLGVSWEVLK
ncbi:hypothetical protein M404DRAFT_679210 [Pisolithus tinctorius Marx 270]|uniref:Uncharacterized protein n=1 Tax=Pisolithus tinctorius Marx 270 TaxID=870435 RepID=A0A0C3PUK7_PISTI|nr:hypothetical protein M404DRAFT_679210 [Pisolithus tinctorius Marx 270]